MKPLYHPALKDITVEGILYAFSDPVRVRIYADIAKADCAMNCTMFSKVDNKTLPKSTLSQHFKVLREVGLVKSERKGVEMHNTTRCEELNSRFGELIPTILGAYAGQGKKPKK